MVIVISGVWVRCGGPTWSRERRARPLVETWDRRRRNWNRRRIAGCTFIQNQSGTTRVSRYSIVFRRRQSSIRAFRKTKEDSGDESSALYTNQQILISTWSQWCLTLLCARPWEGRNYGRSTLRTSKRTLPCRYNDQESLTSRIVVAENEQGYKRIH